jgi:hypothetical protein
MKETMRGEVSVNTGVAGGCEEKGGCRKYRREGERGIMEDWSKMTHLSPQMRVEQPPIK